MCHYVARYEDDERGVRGDKLLTSTYEMRELKEVPIPSSYMMVRYCTVLSTVPSSAGPSPCATRLAVIILLLFLFSASQTR